jgi:hypothetical protein
VPEWIAGEAQSADPDITHHGPGCPDSHPFPHPSGRGVPLIIGQDLPNEALDVLDAAVAAQA